MSRNTGKIDPDVLAERFKDNYVVHYDVIVDHGEPVDDVFCVRKIKTAEDLMQLPMESYVRLAAGRENIAHDSLESAITDYENKIAGYESYDDLPSFRAVNLSDEEKQQVKSAVKTDMGIDICEYHNGDISPADITQTRFDRSAYTFDNASLADRLSRIELPSSEEPIVEPEDLPF